MAQLVECLPGMHETLGLNPAAQKKGMVHMPRYLAFGR